MPFDKGRHNLILSKKVFQNSEKARYLLHNESIFSPQKDLNMGVEQRLRQRTSLVLMLALVFFLASSTAHAQQDDIPTAAPVITDYWDIPTSVPVITDYWPTDPYDGGEPTQAPLFTKQQVDQPQASTNGFLAFWSRLVAGLLALVASLFGRSETAPNASRLRNLRERRPNNGVIRDI